MLDQIVVEVCNDEDERETTTSDMTLDFLLQLGSLVVSMELAK